jgi:hypothetical protein
MGIKKPKIPKLTWLPPSVLSRQNQLVQRRTHGNNGFHVKRKGMLKHGITEPMQTKKKEEPQAYDPEPQTPGLC